MKLPENAYADILPTIRLELPIVPLRLGCLYANAFSKAFAGEGCTGPTPRTGGFRRISIWAYPGPTENGGGAANGTTEQCDG